MGDHGDSEEEEEIEVNMSQMPTNKSLHADDNNKGKTINDDIWQHIYMSSWCFDVIDTQYFQRMRDIAQLGCVEYVYPGATHKRFEHSIGVGYLSQLLISKFRHTQKELDVSYNEVKAVTWAGLCHDLGHGPFSHVYENEFLQLEALPDHDMHVHELRSAAMFEHIIETSTDDAYGEYGEPIDIDDDLRRMVCDMICASHQKDRRKKYAQQGRGFLLDIVANGRNSVDVDKFDYLKRDARNANVNIAADFGRIMRGQRVIDDEICFRKNDFLELSQVFRDRMTMHQRVYTHKKAKAIEYMVVDAMREADHVLPHDEKYSQMIYNMEDFLRLDDTVLRQIQFSRNPDMAKAQGILRRLNERNLYQYLVEYTVPDTHLRDYKKVTAEDILAYAHNDGTVKLTADDIIVHNCKIDYSMKDENPFASIFFYNDSAPDVKFHQKKEKYRLELPGVFLQRSIRIFTRSRESRVQDAVRKAAKNFKKKVYGGSDDWDDSSGDEQYDNDITPIKSVRKTQAVKRRRLTMQAENGDLTPHQERGDEGE